MMNTCLIGGVAAAAGVAPDPSVAAARTSAPTARRIVETVATNPGLRRVALTMRAE
jgi:hypothetical protein